jgi:hypothetical protein
MSHPALADDGPLEGKGSLTVEEIGGEWPQTTLWIQREIDAKIRHEYRLTDRSNGPVVLPVYSYILTLPTDEN